MESLRSFDILSQRSIENLESICIYPATELILSKEQLVDGIAKIEADAKKQEEVFDYNTKLAQEHARLMAELLPLC